MIASNIWRSQIAELSISFHTTIKLNSKFIVFGTSSTGQSIIVDNHIIEEAKISWSNVRKQLSYQQHIKNVQGKIAQRENLICSEKFITILIAKNSIEFSCNKSCSVLSCFTPFHLTQNSLTTL